MSRRLSFGRELAGLAALVTSFTLVLVARADQTKVKPAPTLAPAKDEAAASAVGPGNDDPTAPLSDLARELLKKRMQRHGADMRELVLETVLLKHSRVAELATRVANEPRLVRPVAGGEDEVGAAIPERFFLLQDQLRSQAQRLADAAKARNDKQMAAHFAELSATCMSCHSAYLTKTTLR